MKYFIGGFTWSSGSQLDRFLTEGIWENGYGTDKYSDKFKKISVGDRFALKLPDQDPCLRSLTIKSARKISGNREHL